MSRTRITKPNSPSGIYDRAEFFAGYLRLIARRIREEKPDAEDLALEAIALAEEFESWTVNPGPVATAAANESYHEIRRVCRARGLDV